MLRKRFPLVLAILLVLSTAAVLAENSGSEAYRLTPRMGAGDVAEVSLTYEVGGDLIETDDDGKQVRTPMSVVAKMVYDEQLVAWWADASIASRSLRRYSEARATIKKGDKGATFELADDQREIVAKAGGESTALNGLDHSLTREQYDLINIQGNTLVIDRLLPNRELTEGEGWDHDPATMAALLGMDHVAVCEVRSVVTGQENGQVKIRLAGTVHGTFDGASSEMDLRGAYLFHLDEGRITKFNLAVKEVRKRSEISPGLDVVAKLSLAATPVHDKTELFDAAAVENARILTTESLSELLLDSPQRGYRFLYDSSWYITAEHRDLMSLRRLGQGALLARCNLNTLPARPESKPMTLQEFEADVCKSLGDKLSRVEAATEWANAAGHQCLGVITVGEVEDVPVEWRHYLVAAEGMRQVSVSVTVEQSLLERFGDADKSIIDSMVLIADEIAAETAAKPTVKR
jgi:hypothetical protein